MNRMVWTIEQDGFGNRLLCWEGRCITVLPDDPDEAINCAIDAALEFCMPSIIEAYRVDGVDI